MALARTPLLPANHEGRDWSSEAQLTPVGGSQTDSLHLELGLLRIDNPRGHPSGRLGRAAARQAHPTLICSSWQPSRAPLTQLQTPEGGQGPWCSILPSPDAHDRAAHDQQGGVSPPEPLQPTSLAPCSAKAEGPDTQDDRLPVQQLSSAAAAVGPPPSPFNSSQERRDEIQLLTEMAACAFGDWSSQEEQPAAVYEPRSSVQECSEASDPQSQPGKIWPPAQPPVADSNLPTQEAAPAVARLNQWTVVGQEQQRQQHPGHGLDCFSPRAQLSPEQQQQRSRQERDVLAATCPIAKASEAQPARQPGHCPY